MKPLVKFFAICCLYALFTEPFLAAANLHVVIAADTESDLAEGIQADLYLVDQEIHRISRYTGLTLKKRIFSGSAFDPMLLVDYLKTLDVKSDDALIYYHSSHGFRTETMQKAWPALDFGTKAALDLADVVSIIQSKPQRFALILADCCNNCIPAWANPPFYHWNLGQPWNIEKARMTNYRKLFMEQRGIIVAAAASPGQYAWIDLYFGGFFTTSFLAQLQTCCDQKTTDVSWQEILERTKAATRERCIDAEFEQTPIYAILED